MRKLIFLLLAIAAFSMGFAQDPKVKELVRAGIKLHDAGDYEGALGKYDEALKLDENDFDANYEKSLTYMQMKKYKECEKQCKELLKKFSDHPNLHQVYSNYGSVLDDLGKVEEAIAVFDEGIQKFPDYHLLYFNKGLTQMRGKKNTDALLSYQEALRRQPLHPSSNYYSGLILENSNRIPALLSVAMFLLTEPQSQRSKGAYEKLQALINQGISKTGEKSVNISIDPSMLDDKKKGSENNFSMIDFMFTLVVSSATDEKLKELTGNEAGKLSYLLQMLTNSLDNAKKDGRGFYWEHYVPFFTDMKAKDYTETAAHIIALPSGDEDNKKWIEENEEKVSAFYEWLGKYKWATKK